MQVYQEFVQLITVFLNRLHVWLTVDNNEIGVLNIYSISDFCNMHDEHT